MPAPLTLASLGQLPLPGTDIPAAIAFTPDGGALTYLQSTDGSLVRSLWWHDLASGERRVILGPQSGTEHETTLSHEEHLRRERTRTSELGVTEFAWATHAERPTLVVPVGGQVFVGSGPDGRRCAGAAGWRGGRVSRRGRARWPARRVRARWRPVGGGPGRRRAAPTPDR